MNGLERLVTSPPIARNEDLIDRLDEWADLLRKYGSGMDERMQMTHLLKIVPQYWKGKIIENRDLQSPSRAIAHIQLHQRWNRAEKLSAARMGKPEAAVDVVQEQPGKAEELLAAMNDMVNDQERDLRGPIWPSGHAWRSSWTPWRSRKCKQTTTTDQRL